MSLICAAHFQLFSRHSADVVRWRLLSGNNREIGRGDLEYLDVEECLLGIKELITTIGGLELRVRRSSTREWRWYLAQGSTMIARSCHGFDRQIRCEQAGLRFLLDAPRAAIIEDLMLPTPRRWSASASRAILPA